MKNFRINSTDAINNFLLDLYCKSGMIFDPADDIRKLCYRDGNPLFPKDESEYLDNVMTECFIYCVHNNLDIYQIARQVQSEISQRKAVA